MPESGGAAAVITGFVCPLLGMLIANFMWLSPLPIILEARYTRNIGNINPLPFVITLFNCVGWLIYACLKNDFFIFFANIFGIALGLFYSINCLTIISKKAPKEEFSTQYLCVEYLLMFAFFFWGTMGIVCATAFNGNDTPIVEATNMVGYISSSFAIAYYAAPLATMLQVIKTKDSSSLYLPMILINCTNGLLWSSYGFIALRDINVYGPNVIGVILSSLQILMTFIFPKKAKEEKVVGWGYYIALMQGKLPANYAYQNVDIRSPTEKNEMRAYNLDDTPL